ncbi:MAG: orotidine-5'-phosphate decarboxylase [Cyclobacteriaceae bacterium]|nr:orotidine-5'-phosphate decarboxylase [Cyclobacteriaceae bacterium]
MTREELIAQIKKKKSFLCVGLDTDIKKIPQHLLKFQDPVFEFNKQIIDATIDYAVAYKPNLAFYESLGAAGWESLEKTVEYLPKDVFKIADAKRGDIGNTSGLYARAFFEHMNFDAITVAPYMGEDSVKPFLEYPGKWAILLALTSNKGSADFQTKFLDGGTKHLYEEVLEKSSRWGTTDNMMYVVGATKAESLAHIRTLVPDHFLLVPGVGAQGGSLSEVARYGMNKDCGLLVNASRSIIYADDSINFAAAAAREAKLLQEEMEQLLGSIF